MGVERKLTEQELRKIRESIYAKEVYHNPILSKTVALKQLLRGLNGEVLHVPSKALRARNFKLFVEQNFNTDFDVSPWPEVKTGLKAYKNLQEYSETKYGAAMIHRVLEDNKKKAEADWFEVRYNDGTNGDFAQAGYNFVLFSKNFPNNSRFPGGEVKFAPAIIHHEFGHTRFFTHRTGPIEVQLEHEQKAVLENSNPARIYHNIEPRYTYTNAVGQTINIINGARCAGNCTIKEDDPRVLVQKGTAGARKW